MAQPILGILTHTLRTAEPSELCGPLTAHIRDLVEHAQQLGWVAYVYSPRDLLKQRRVVWGWTRENGNWRRDFFPTPHVSYIRSLSWYIEDMAVIRWLKQETPTHFLNNPDIEEIVHDRWRVIQIGLSHPTLTERFPDTVLLRSGLDIRAYLKEMDRCIVINRFRSFESRYASIARHDNEYTFRFLTTNVAHTLTLKSPEEVQEKILHLFGEAILYSSLDSIRIEDCPISIRSLWQRSRTLRWQETCCLVRIGKEQSVIGPLATAGLFEQFLPLLEEVISGKSDALRYQIQSIARMIVELIDHRGHGASELAVDLTVTNDSKVFVTDVSTIGGIDSLRRLSQPALRQQMITNTMNYASVLFEQQSALSEQIPVPLQTD